uniref:Uncharacterized protein n=1 Tax=Romanomermis culicivorax TaxID=13658 RepID=A0A915KQ89_ROMCU
MQREILMGQFQLVFLELDQQLKDTEQLIAARNLNNKDTRREKGHSNFITSIKKKLAQYCNQAGSTDTVKRNKFLA